MSFPFPDRVTRLIALVVCGLLLRGVALAQAPGPTFAPVADESSFRVFLRDGTAVVSYGDVARVDDRLIFSMPVGDGLHVVNLPISSVDLPRTEQYCASVRAARYATTSGEADYNALTNGVATALNRIASTHEPLERLRIAETMRGVAAAWGRDHFGYRSSDVRQIQALLDELVSDLNADAGITQFNLNLVASVEPPSDPILPAPTPAEAIEQVLRVARTTDLAADRVVLLQGAVRMLAQPVPGRSADWIRHARESATVTIAAELRIDRAYRDLSRDMVVRAAAAAATADPSRVEELVADARRRDQRLGHRRPAEIAGLMTALEGHLDSARRLRLARDRWQLQLPALRNYEDLSRPGLQQLARARKALDAIRRLSGPDPAALERLRARVTQARQLIARISPPAGVESVHATLASACQLALTAADTRRRAVESGDLQVAWDASSAAAGAIMLLAQARDGLQAALRPPELK